MHVRYSTLCQYTSTSSLLINLWSDVNPVLDSQDPGGQEKLLSRRSFLWHPHPRRSRTTATHGKTQLRLASTVAGSAALAASGRRQHRLAVQARRRRGRCFRAEQALDLPASTGRRACHRPSAALTGRISGGCLFTIVCLGWSASMAAHSWNVCRTLDPA